MIFSMHRNFDISTKAYNTLSTKFGWQWHNSLKKEQKTDKTRSRKSFHAAVVALVFNPKNVSLSVCGDQYKRFVWNTKRFIANL